MTARAREWPVRVGLTVAVAALLGLVLWAAPYTWRFEATWKYHRLFLRGLLTTLQVAPLAFALALPLGVGVALLRLSRALWIRHLGDLYVEVIRGTPFIVQLMIAYFGIASVLGIDNKFIVGTAALALFAAAYVGEIVRGGIQSVERGQFEAARSLGLSRRQTLRHVVFPQAFRRMVPPLTGELLALTKESSLLFVIGVFELTTAARQVGASSYKQFEAYLVVALLYLTLTVPLSLLSRRLERRFARSEARSGLDL